MAMNIEAEYDKIFRYCYYRVRNQNLAEDITKETFLRFYNSNYVEQQKGIRYLYTIARNLCIDESRKRQWCKLDQDEEISDDGNQSERMTDDLYMEELLDILSEEERVLAVMRFVNDEPMALICEELCISRFAAYRKLEKIKAKLRTWLGRGRNHG